MERLNFFDLQRPYPLSYPLMNTPLFVQKLTGHIGFNPLKLRIHKLEQFPARTYPIDPNSPTVQGFGKRLHESDNSPLSGGVIDQIARCLRKQLERRH